MSMTRAEIEKLRERSNIAVEMWLGKSAKFPYLHGLLLDVATLFAHIDGLTADLEEAVEVMKAIPDNTVLPANVWKSVLAVLAKHKGGPNG